MTWRVMGSKTKTIHNQVKQIEDIEKGKKRVQNNQNQDIIFKDILQYQNICFILILAVSKTTLLTREPGIFTK